MKIRQPNTIPDLVRHSVLAAVCVLHMQTGKAAPAPFGPWTAVTSAVGTPLPGTTLDIDLDGDDQPDHVVLVQNVTRTHTGILVHFANERAPELASVWLDRDGAHVTLSAMAPGRYREHCATTPCHDVRVDAGIGVCFEEASCMIVFREHDRFREFFVTD